MKKLSVLMVVLIVGAQLKAQFIVKPYTLASISPVHPFQLPPLLKPAPLSKPQGVNPVTNYVCTGTCSVPLPLTLLQLSGNRLNNNQVMLNWKTQDEINSRGFNIERSEDGGITFLVVGFVASDTSSNVEKNYELTDLNSYSQTSYYRVKQIDLDGNYTYSNTIAVVGYDIQQKVGLSPNPAANFTMINCFSTSNGKGVVSVLTANGQKLNEIPWSLSAGSNTLKLMLVKYAAGIYYVQLAWPDGSRSVLKLVVK